MGKEGLRESAGIDSVGVVSGDGGGGVSGVGDEKGEQSRYTGCSGGDIGSIS